MVRFEARLERERYEPWASEYLDYALLKRRIKEALVHKEAGRDQLVNALTFVFQGLFDSDIEKVLKFYKGKCKSIQAEADSVQATADKLGAADSGDISTDSAEAKQQVSEIEEAFALLHTTAQDVTNLLAYVSLNAAAVRKILKKAAKKLPTKATYGPGLLTLRIEHPHQPGWKVLQGTFLPLQIGEDMESMRAHVLLVQTSSQMREAFQTLQHRYRQLLSAHPELQPQASGPAQSDAQRKESERPSLARLSTTFSFKYTPKPETSLPAPSSDGAAPPSTDAILEDLEGLLARMQHAESLAHTQTGLVHPHNYQQSLAGIFEPAPKDELALADTWGLYLNCINSGLYMANYNVVIPTITSLCAHIGVSASSAGLIIGSCDIATVVSTIGYSVWTDTNYKLPLLASAIACILGNLAYCVSFDTKSLILLLAGRLITGFGSARAVNRRYIAMFVARKDRTWASAVFVSLSAVGMALGPLLALPLSHAPSAKLAGLTFGPITLGGWFMSIAWVVFIIVSVIFFNDPLVKQKQIDSKKKAQNNDSLRKPLLEGHPGQEGGHAAAGDVEDGRGGTSKANGLAHDSQSHQSLHAVQLHSDHDFPTTTGIYRILDSPAMATSCCIFLCFILKTCQQAYIDGLPVFTESAFGYGWSDGACGIMLGILGLSAPVVNQLVAKSATKISDRLITVGSIVTTAVGGLLLMKGPHPASTFFAGGLAVYMGTIVLEGVSMSLVSKVIDERMSKGFWNAGLLSTQAGTTGRFMGNILLSGSARITGADSAGQLNSLAATMFGSIVAFMAFSLAYVGLCYKRLVG